MTPQFTFLHSVSPNTVRLFESWCTWCLLRPATRTRLFHLRPTAPPPPHPPVSVHSLLPHNISVELARSQKKSNPPQKTPVEQALTSSLPLVPPAFTSSSLSRVRHFLPMYRPQQQQQQLFIQQNSWEQKKNKNAPEAMPGVPLGEAVQLAAGPRGRSHPRRLLSRLVTSRRGGG